MADQTDVEVALVALLAGVIYPNGTGQAPAQGVAAQVFPGWPAPETLASLMTAGNACIWVYARPEYRDCTRYPFQWQTQSITPATITTTVSGRTVTIGGAMPAPFSPHNVFVLMDGQSFGHAVQPTDTLTTIASALATLIAAGFPGASSTGPVITLQNGPLPVARVGTVGQSVLEVGRTEQRFQIVVAANTPASRTALCVAISPALMATSWLTLPDGTAARLKVHSQADDDSGQKVAVYRRNLIASVEYAITQVQTTATVEAIPTTFSGGNAIPLRSF